MRATCIPAMPGSRAAKQHGLLDVGPLDRIAARLHIGPKYTKDHWAMTVLEKAVLDLANALETLETKLEGRLDDQSADGETIEAARGQARAARNHAATVSRELSGAIGDLKSLLDDHDTASKG